MPENSLQHSPADILARGLISLGVGGDPDLANPLWPIYVSDEPAKPDECITLYDTQGQDDGAFMATGTLWQHYGIQVRVKANYARDGYTKANTIRNTLAENVYGMPVTADGINYFIDSVTKVGQVIPLGKSPDSKLSLFTINCMVLVETL